MTPLQSFCHFVVYRFYEVPMVDSELPFCSRKPGEDNGLRIVTKVLTLGKTLVKTCLWQL